MAIIRWGGANRVQGVVCADVGACTGWFTDCLLQHGASRVYAIEVGHGQLHPRLREDPRVVSLEGTDARSLVQLPELLIGSRRCLLYLSARCPARLVLLVEAGW